MLARIHHGAFAPKCVFESKFEAKMFQTAFQNVEKLS